MKSVFSRIVATLCIAALLVAPLSARAESVDDRFTQISPSLVPGAGEFVHGQGHGKLLMRVLVLGAIPVQGVHYVPEGTDLLFAVLYAGGSHETTSLNGITIRRRGASDAQSVDLESLLADGKSIPKLLDGDVVNVPYNWKKNTQTILFVTTLISSLTALTFSIMALAR